MDFEAWKKPFFSEKMPVCPLRGGWLSFALVDETGDGKAYAGLAYSVLDSQGQQHVGHLDGNGYVKLDNPYRGPQVLTFDALHEASGSDYYGVLQARSHYPLPITELQFRAEQTRFVRSDGQRVETNPAQQQANRFYQVEVRDLVRHVAHLPPPAPRSHGPQRHALQMMADLGFGPPQPAYGAASAALARTAPDVVHRGRVLCHEPVPTGIDGDLELLPFWPGTGQPPAR